MIVPDGGTVDLIVETGKLHFFDILTSDKVGVSARYVADAAGLTDTQAAADGLTDPTPDSGTEN